MTRKEAIDNFIAIDPINFLTLNFNKPGALRMLWYHYVYNLYQLKQITKKQFQTWSNPIEASWIFNPFKK